MVNEIRRPNQQDIEPIRINLANGEIVPKEAWRQFSRRYGNFFEAWDIAQGEGRDIIDFDLRPNRGAGDILRPWIVTPANFTTADLTKHLHTLRNEGEFLPAATIDQALDKEFALAHIRASEYYARRRSGEKIPAREYIENTQGIRFERLPDAVIEEQYEYACMLFRELGVDYSKRGLDQFYQSRIITPDQFMGLIQEDADELTKKIADFLDVPLKPSYKYKQVVEDAYWMCWVESEADNILFRLNTHESHLPRFNPGKAKAMQLHELVAHGAQVTAWRDRIAQGLNAETAGITGVYSHQPMIEGLAEVIPEFVPGMTLDLEGEAQRARTILRSMVYHNVHVEVNDPRFTSFDLGFTRQYIEKYLPDERTDGMDREVKERREKPDMQTYMYAYGIGAYVSQLEARVLNEAGKRKLLQDKYSQQMTPTRDITLALQYANDPEYGNPYTYQRDIDALQFWIPDNQ